MAENSTREIVNGDIIAAEWKSERGLLRVTFSLVFPPLLLSRCVPSYFVFPTERLVQARILGLIYVECAHLSFFEVSLVTQHVAWSGPTTAALSAMEGAVFYVFSRWISFNDNEIYFFVSFRFWVSFLLIGCLMRTMFVVWLACLLVTCFWLLTFSRWGQ